ncbi:MAG: SDR family oxidoreductase [Clostridiales bacterium]|nr:SDR family oxidoreductase [Candidatus Equinaster intestinalis]
MAELKKAMFVTGGTVGSGLAIAERFAKEGFDVFITSRSQERAQEAADKVAAKYGVFAKGYALDIRNEQAVKDIFADIDSLGRLVKTVCLNSADMGFGTDPTVGMDALTVPIEEFQRVFETNLVWNFMIIRQAVLRMKENGGGAIVFIGSNTSHRVIPNRSAYCASKGGINSLSKALAIDFGKFGVRSNVVLPGTIKTERWVQMGSKQIVNGTLTPIGDISDFEDVANAAWFLGSDEAKNVTGAEIMLDGGMTAQLYPPKLNEYKRLVIENGLN